MTETKTANEFSKVRIFQLAIDLEREMANAEDYDHLEKALGLKIVQRADVQIVSAVALHDLGLAQFLMMGHGIAEADIAPEMDRLNSLDGSFAVIRSGAFGPDEVTFHDTDDINWIATFDEEGTTSAPLNPLTSDSSKGSVPAPEVPVKKPKSDARIGGMVATVALLLMGLLVWLMIWIGS